MKIANNFDEFVKKVEEATRNALNKTEIGQELTEKLLRISLEKNPNMTAEEWQTIKSQFLTVVFYGVVKEKPELMHEFAGHAYNELRD